MSDLRELMRDEEQEAAEPKASQDEQAEQADQSTGEEVAAPPAEPEQKQDSRQEGLQAALLAERRKRQQLEERLQAMQQPKQAPTDDKPNPADFQDNPAEYWVKLARYEARQALQEVAQAHAAEREREELARQQQKMQERLDEVVTEGRGKYADFDVTINRGLAPFLSDELRLEIASNEGASDIAYFLAKNPEVADRVSKLDPRSMAREVAKLSAKVTASAKPTIPQTLTTARDARGQFTASARYDGPTPLNDILGIKD